MAMIRSGSARFAVSVAAVVLVVFATAGVALAADLKVMSTVALNAAFDELKPKFERATGHSITLVYSVIADLKKRIQDGETADLMFLSRGALDDLEAQGKVAAGSIVNVAKSSVAVAAREGVPKPDISTTDALKATLLGAKSVVYADPAKGGASGVHFAKIVEKLGIADAMKPKTVLVPGAQAAEVVSKGQAELGVAMASEIVPVPGAQLVGVLPSDVGMTLVFSAGVGATNKDREAASALIRFITGPEGVAVLKSKGMDTM
jgi:molybdate transport system substrate-binding protein